MRYDFEMLFDINSYKKVKLLDDDFMNQSSGTQNRSTQKLNRGGHKFGKTENYNKLSKKVWLKWMQEKSRKQSFKWTLCGCVSCMVDVGF